MKKRIITVLLALVMALSVTACGGRKVVSTDLEETEDSGKGSGKSDETTGETTGETGAEESKDAKVPASDGVVLGGEFDENYDGFKYLYCEVLMTESEENATTGKMESQKFNVFLPNGDYTSVNRDTAYADYLGVTFHVMLDPYIQYEEENYTLKENLEAYMAENYDEFYTTSYKALEVSDVESTEKGVRATANYCYYDDWNDTYIPMYCTYYLTELPGDVMALVEVEVDGSSTTGKTEEMLGELEAFYEFSIDWDQNAAEKKVSALLASDEVNHNLISTGYLICELPAGWSQDYSYGDYSDNAFAPDGDANEAGCVISFSYEYLGADSFDLAEQLQSEEDVAAYLEYLEGSMGDTVSDISVEYIGETAIGNTMKITYTEEDGSYRDSTLVYLATKDSYAYTVQAIAVDGCEVDMEAVAAEALATAKIREY